MRANQMRFAAVVVALAAVSMTAPGASRAEEVAAPEPVLTSSDEVKAIVQRVRAGAAADRLAAARELAAVTGAAVEPLKELLARTRSASIEQRRDALRAIGASIPDKSGKFSNPKRESKSETTKDDEFDWLADLLATKSAGPGLLEAAIDVAIIRALARSYHTEAARVVLDFGFSDEGMIYRDECGRYLRKMAPYSLPALVRSAAITRKVSSERRYATYQLERLDLESPQKAVRATSGDEKLKAELLWTYGDAGYRAAVSEVLAFTNDDSPAIREAARKGFMKYVTTTPPPAPKRKLVKPGGELSKEEQPLYLDYREIADIELRRTHQEVFGEAPARRTKLADIAGKLFDHWDGARAAVAGKEVDAALALAAGGDVAGASQRLDQILALEDATDRGPEIARVYLQRARALEEAGEHRAAAGAYGKVNALDPEGEHAQSALASHYFNLGKAVQAEGGDPQPMYARAAEIEPRHGGAARALAEGDDAAARKTWMLYAGVGGGAFALLLLVVGLVTRKH